MNIPLHLKIVLTEMCHRVGVKFEDVDFTADGWFMNHTWTLAEQEDFQHWLIDYLKNNKEARGEIMQNPTRIRKKDLQRISAWFVLQWGWKIFPNPWEGK